MCGPQSTTSCEWRKPGPIPRTWARWRRPGEQFRADVCTEVQSSTEAEAFRQRPPCKDGIATGAGTCGRVCAWAFAQPRARQPWTKRHRISIDHLRAGQRLPYDTGIRLPGDTGLRLEIGTATDNELLAVIAVGIPGSGSGMTSSSPGWERLRHRGWASGCVSVIATGIPGAAHEQDPADVGSMTISSPGQWRPDFGDATLFGWSFILRLPLLLFSRKENHQCLHSFSVRHAMSSPLGCHHTHRSCWQEAGAFGQASGCLVKLASGCLVTLA